MRLIRFRAKRIDNGEWVYGDLMNYGNGVFVMGSYSPIGYQMTRVDPDTVGQCTALRDKSGQEIYEGDIIQIKLTDGSTTKSCVGWHKLGHLGCDIGINHGVQLGLIDKGRIEVVDNIHDNPELLKGGKK